MGRGWVLVAFCGGLAQGCGPAEPVLPAVESPEQAEAASRELAARKVSTSAEATKTAALPYKKVEGIYVDVRWFGGRSYLATRDELVGQMGMLLDRREISVDEGEELAFARGLVHVVRDTIYMMRVDLPRPVTRSEALVMCGFSPFADHWRATHREFRLAHTFGFSRFRLKRAPGTEDRVIQVEAWKVEPDEAGN